MAKLSVVISAYNEENNIEACFKTVLFADEIIFIDNQSTDKTVSIAKQYTKKVYSRPNNLMLNVNKNYGFTKATGEWILSLDADEQIEEDLCKEIQNIIGNNGDNNSYRIPRKNIIFGKWMKHTGWYPDHQLRLFKRGVGKFAEKHVHEQIEVTGTIGQLRGHILHNNYTSVSQFLKKMDLYTTNEADNRLAKGYDVKPLDGLLWMKEEFFNRYFVNHGYKDGMHGFVLSLLMSCYYLVVFAKLWEHQGFTQRSVAFEIVTEELTKTGSESVYWRRWTKAQNAPGAIGRLFARLFG